MDEKNVEICVNLAKKMFALKLKSIITQLFIYIYLIYPIIKIQKENKKAKQTSYNFFADSTFRKNLLVSNVTGKKSENETEIYKTLRILVNKIYNILCDS